MWLSQARTEAMPVVIKLAPDAPIKIKLDSDFRIEGVMVLGGRSPVNRTKQKPWMVMYYTKLN